MSSGRDGTAARPRGRHLLRSSRLADAILAAARVEPGDPVVDLGAGSGMPTAGALPARARLVAVEPDARLPARVRRACARADVLTVDVRTLRWPEEPFLVVANLPFAHATDVLRAV